MRSDPVSFYFLTCAVVFAALAIGFTTDYINIGQSDCPSPAEVR